MDIPYALHGLASVDLSNTDLVDDAFAEIGKLSQLKTLAFSDCVFVTDKGISALAHHASLENIVASSCGITDASTEALSTIGSLEHLWLDDTYVRSLATLAACKKLKWLSLSSNEVPIEDALLFSKHKECSIQIQDPSNEVAQYSFSGCGSFSEPLQHLTNTHLSNMSGETNGMTWDILMLNGLVGLSAKHIENFGCDITEVSLARSKVQSDVFKFLRNWPMLKSLDVTMCPATEADLQAIGELSNLISLELAGTEIDDRRMLEIRTLRKLKTLTLGKTKITPQSLEVIKGFKQLRSLTLPFVPDAAFLIELLEACPSLLSIEVSIADSNSSIEIQSPDALRLHNIELTADQFDRLLRLHLQRASETSIVAGQKLNDQHCAILANISGIEELDLSSSNLTDAGIAHLAKLPELDTLNISDTSVTAVGLRSLQPKPLSMLVCDPRTWSTDFVEALLEFKELSELSVPFSAMPPEVAFAFAFASGSVANKLAWFENGPEWEKRFYIMEDDIDWMVGRSPFNTNTSHLTLMGSLIDDAKVAEVTASPAVEYVHVKNVCCKTEALMAKLLACRNAKQLSLSGVQLAPSDIQRLAELEHLECLNLANCELTHEHFAELSRLSNLSTLWISGDFAELDGLLSLTKLSRPRKLKLITMCSTEKYAELQLQLGKRCEIVRSTR